MAWIDAEYAEEVAVVATWLSAVLPWSVAYTSDAPSRSRILFLRLPAVGLQLRFPTEVTVDGDVVDAGVPEALADQYGGMALAGTVHLEVPPLQFGAVDGTLAVAYALWSLAALLVLVTVGVSVAMYLREDAVRARLPVGYVGFTSVALGALAVLLAGSTAAFASSDAAYGGPVPLGVAIVAAFALVLWRAERVPAGE